MRPQHLSSYSSQSLGAYIQNFGRPEAYCSLICSFFCFVLETEFTPWIESLPVLSQAYRWISTGPLLSPTLWFYIHSKPSADQIYNGNGRQKTSSTSQNPEKKTVATVIVKPIGEDNGLKRLLLHTVSLLPSFLMWPFSDAHEWGQSSAVITILTIFGIAEMESTWRYNVPRLLAYKYPPVHISRTIMNQYDLITMT